MTYVRVVLALFLVTACATGASDGDAAMSDLDSGVPSDDGAVSDGAVSDGAVSEDGGDEDAGAADAAPPDSGPGDLCLGVDCSALDDACMVGTCDPADGSCAAARAAVSTMRRDAPLGVSQPWLGQRPAGWQQAASGIGEIGEIDETYFTITIRLEDKSFRSVGNIQVRRYLLMQAYVPVDQTGFVIIFLVLDVAYILENRLGGLG